MELIGHDTKPSRVNLFLWKRFLSILDGVIFLSEESRAAISSAYPGVRRLPSALIKHGHYGPWIDGVRTAAEALGRIGVKGEEVNEALRRLMKHEADDVRAAAEAALKALVFPEDPHADLRRAIARFVRRQGR